jgi:hypothetical protein
MGSLIALTVVADGTNHPVGQLSGQFERHEY